LQFLAESTHSLVYFSPEAETGGSAVGVLIALVALVGPILGRRGCIWKQQKLLMKSRITPERVVNVRRKACHWTGIDEPC
jgi:hypothetical protein